MTSRLKIRILRFGYIVIIRLPIIVYYSLLLLVDNFSIRKDKKLLKEYAAWYYSRVKDKESLYKKINLVENYLFTLAKLNSFTQIMGNKLQACFSFKKNKYDVKENAKNYNTNLVGAGKYTSKLYSFCRKSAYMLLTDYGDLDGAIRAFDQLNPITQNQNSDLKNKANIMQLILQDILNLENKLKKDYKDIEQDGQSERLVISTMIWGDQYLYLFTEYCIPSLKAKGNLCDLKHIEIYWHVFTTNEGRRYLTENNVFDESSIKENIRYEIIPDEIINISSRKNRYWLLGAYTQTSLRYAAYLKADIHFSNPDIVYGSEFFQNIYSVKKQKNKNLILSSSFSAKSKTISVELDKFKVKNKKLEITARKLHGLGLDHLQELYKNCFLSPDEIRSGLLPGMPLIGWKDLGALVIHIPYMNPMLVDKELLTQDMQLSYYTIDSEIVKILRKVNTNKLSFYIVDSDDDIGFIEISEIKAESINHKISRKEFKRNFRGAKGEDEFKMFCNELRLPHINDLNQESVVSANATACSRQFEKLKKEISEYLEIIH